MTTRPDVRGGPTLLQLSEDLEAGRTTSRALVEACLERIDLLAGQGRVAFISVDREGARAAADASDRLRAAGRAQTRFAGIPVSIKDLFDIAGQTTRAGSLALDEGPAAADAVAVARLRAAGFVPIGRTNMTEFAFSGLGLNPHYGTPLSPWRRDEGHIAGGSTSGGAVSVADGMAHAALGSDTGGSCRIPAAWCGLTGYKPSWSRVPLTGSVPLSRTLDVAGQIARSVDCCAVLDAFLSGDDAAREPAKVRGLRVLAPTNFVLTEMDDIVAESFVMALGELEKAGAQVDRKPLAPLDAIPGINAKGGFAAAESWAWHRERIDRAGGRYDPRVLVRIRRGIGQDETDLLELVAARGRLVEAMQAELAEYDVVAMPTTPIVPPRLSDLEDDAEYGRINLLALRNPTTINMIGGCALSLPIPARDGAPVGLMLASVQGDDARLLAVGEAVEASLAA